MTKKAKKKAEKKAHANGSNGAATPRGEPIERSRYMKQLPVRIDDAAVALKAEELAKVIHEREDVLEERREAAAEFREKLGFYNKRLTELALAVEKHTELRSVECAERLTVETNEIEVVRIDTGETVETRPADAEDRQEALFTTEPREEPEPDPLESADDGTSTEELAAELGEFRALGSPLEAGGFVQDPTTADRNAAKRLRRRRAPTT